MARAALMPANPAPLPDAAGVMRAEKIASFRAKFNIGSTKELLDHIAAREEQLRDALAGRDKLLYALGCPLSGVEAALKVIEAKNESIEADESRLRAMLEIAEGMPHEAACPALHDEECSACGHEYGEHYGVFCVDGTFTKPECNCVVSRLIAAGKGA